MLNNNSLLEEYTKLKELEKLVELNLGVLEEFNALLQDNLEELEEISHLLPHEEQVIYEKLRASTKLLLSHLEVLMDEMEQLWEEVELAMVELLLRQQTTKGRDSFFQHLREKYVCKIDTLKEFMDIQWSILKEDVENYKLYKKFPYGIYSGFLEKLLEFNRKIQNQ